MEQKIELFRKGKSTLGVVIRPAGRKAGLLNKVLAYYPSDTKFYWNDEPVFYFPEHQLKTVLKVLGLRHEELGISSEGSVHRHL